MSMNEVLAAVASAAGKVQKVAKDGRNDHDKYDFASIDSFLGMVRPHLSETGLVISMDEAGIEDFTRKGRNGDSAWMRMRWQITVYHSSGQSMPPVHRTVEVLRNGSQAYGSAQSYVLKQFLRALLQIATGDKDDADLAPKDDGQIVSGTVTPDQVDELRSLIEETASDEAAFCRAAGVKSLEEILQTSLGDAKARLIKKRDRIAADRENGDAAGN